MSYENMSDEELLRLRSEYKEQAKIFETDQHTLKIMINALNI